MERENMDDCWSEAVECHDDYTRSQEEMRSLMSRRNAAIRRAWDLTGDALSYSQAVALLGGKISVGNLRRILETNS